MSGKRRKLDKAKRVKAVARERVGSPKPARILEERTRKTKPKHKKGWQEEAGTA